MTTRRIIQILGVLSALVLMALWYTGYQITQKPLSILIWLLFITSITVEIYVFIERKWIRVATLILWFLGIAAWVLFQQFIAAFANGENTVLREWTHGHYHARYCRRLDWAGPQYHRYDLDKELLT